MTTDIALTPGICFIIGCWLISNGLDNIGEGLESAGRHIGEGLEDLGRAIERDEPGE